MLTDLALRIYRDTEDKVLTSEPLISVGEFPSSFKPRLPKLVTENESWMIIHAGEFIQYSYNVKSETNVTSIYFLIPLNKKLSFNDSVYDILHEAYTISNVPEGTSIDKQEIESIIKKCKLLTDDGLSVPFMAGKEPASFRADSKAQTAALLRFSKYKILATVCQLEVSYDCETTIKLPIKSKSRSERDAQEINIPKAEPLFLDSSNSNNTSIPKAEPLFLDSSNNISSTDDENDDDTEEKKSRKPLIIGVIVLLIVGGLAAYFLKGGSSENTSLAKNENVEVPVAVKDSVQSEPKKEETKPEKVKNIEKEKAEKAVPTKENKKEEKIEKKEIKKEKLKIPDNSKELKEEALKKLKGNGNAKSSEDYRKEILALANQGNISKIRTLKKYLSKKELFSMEFVLGDVKKNFPDVSASGHKKIAKKIQSAKPFSSIQEIVNLGNVLIMTSSEY